MNNNVKFGLKNVHYSVITDNAGVISYGTPKRIRGAVDLTMEPKGEKSEFYADDMAYFVTTANQGYEGTLEVALIPDEFRIDVLGDKVDKNGALIEKSGAVPKNIALMYEFSGDKHATRHVSYNVSVARPSVAGQTKAGQLTPQTETLKITASPAVDTGDVKAKLKPGQNGYDAFYSAVYLEDAPLNAGPEDKTYSLGAGADLEIVITSTLAENTIKDVLIGGVSIGGLNVDVDGLEVTILEAYMSKLAQADYVITVELEKGNAVTIDLSVVA